MADIGRFELLAPLGIAQQPVSFAFKKQKSLGRASQ